MASLRKEQVLFVLAAAFGYWMYSGLETVKKGRPYRVTEKEYEPQPSAAPITVMTPGPKNLHELFVEPSESRPLPPRDDLPFPDLDTLPVVLLPLEIGPQAPAYYRLRHAPLPAPAGPAKAGGEGANAANQNPANPNEGNGDGGALVQDDPRQRYDGLSVSRQVFNGFFLGKDEEKFDLASRKGPYAANRTIRFQWIDEKTGITKKVLEYPGEDVDQLLLAKTLRNEVGMRLFEFRPTSNEAHRGFIRYLLQKARLEPWVYEKALERAEAYCKVVKLAEEGLLYKAKVFRAQGDLGAEYQLFKDLDEHPKLKGSSFQMRGLGMVEARLGLDKLAERHLRKAVAINDPIDPRNYAALADFLLDRGRGPEAVEPATNAVAYKNRRDTSDAERVDFHTTKVRALLAVGDVAGAAAAVAAPGAALQHLADHQGACVAYAKGDFAAAVQLFRDAYKSGRVPDALLGISACQLATGKIVEAKQSLEKVADENPRLRHLALAGLGLALSSSKGNDALEKIDAAIVTYPNHPYLLYLRGRQRRLNGDLDGAVDPLKKALRLHDDFLEALAELTVVHFELFKRSGDVQSLVSARRYVDRLAELDQKQGAKDALFLEMQGEVHYHARDVRGARAAFAKGAQVSHVCDMGLAMLDYQQKRMDLAETRLIKMVRDLPKEGAEARFRDHASKLLTLMVRHADKEQVTDRFERKELGKAWGKPEISGQARPKLVHGELLMAGQLAPQSGRPVVARRSMVGAGRFLQLSVQMKAASDNTSTFAGVRLTIPSGRSGGSSRFVLRAGMNEDREFVLELKDGRKVREPVRTGIKVTPDEWHTIRVSVDDADDADPKDTNRYLQVFFDGQQIVDPKKAKLTGLKRTDVKSSRFDTELRVEGNPRFKVDVAFDDYRRIQEKMK